MRSLELEPGRLQFITMLIAPGFRVLGSLREGPAIMLPALGQLRRFQRLGGAC